MQFVLPLFFNHRGMKKWQRQRQACLCLGLFRVLKKSGLGKPLSKASSGQWRREGKTGGGQGEMRWFYLSNGPIVLPKKYFC